MPYREPGAVSDECPVSRLSRTTINLLNHVARAEFIRSMMINPGMGGGSGPVSMYGPDLSEWPSYMVEAVEIFIEENSKVNRRLMDNDQAPKIVSGR